MIGAKDQRGFTSIVVCLIIMTIMSLVSIGFSRLMSIEQRQATERQLSTGALYAAESGINDARLVTKLNPLYAKNTCDDLVLPSPASTVSKTMPNGTNAQITCVTVNQDIQSLQYDVSTDPLASTIVPITPNDGTQRINTLALNWRGKTGHSYPNGLSGLIPLTGWSSLTGVLKLTIVGFPGGNIDRNTLLANTRIMYLVPSSTGISALSINDVGNELPNTDGAYLGSVQRNVQCNNDNCALRLTEIPSTYTHIRVILTSLYRDNSLTITGSGINGAFTFKGTQASIDSTARVGEEVIRRIEARISLESEKTSVFNTNGLALLSNGTICKEISVGANVTNSCN